jgi:PadR family transcriptional regulator PadR
MTDLLLGTLDLMILKILAREPMHGWGISDRIEWMSGQVFSVTQGSLYPALQRLQRKGWLASVWGKTAENRRARYYELTATGRKQLAREEARWAETTGAVNRVLKLVEEEG